MTGRLPEPPNTEHYRRVPFQFTEECIVLKKSNFLDILPL